MARSKPTILEAELKDLPLFEMVMEAQTGTGLACQTGTLFVGTVEATFVVALGPLSGFVKEQVDEWQTQARAALEKARLEASGGQESPP